MFSKLFGTTGRQEAPLLETPRAEAKTFRQLMGAPGEGANAKEQTSLTEQERKKALQNRLMEIQAKHEPEPEVDPVEDQEDIALVQYVFETKPHIMKKVLQSILEGSLSNPSNNGVV
jgi:hypothetical protein